MRDDSLGIYSVEAKKFFYLETGALHVQNPIPRLRNTLQQRGLIDFSPQHYLSTHNYKIVPVKQAKLENWEMEPIYISEHIRKIVQEAENEETQVSSSSRRWGKKSSNTNTDKANKATETKEPQNKPQVKKTRSKRATRKLKQESVSK
jgi:hypothetical protein